MNEDMKRFLEELEQDLLKDDLQEESFAADPFFDEDLLEDMPQKLKPQNREHDDFDAFIETIIIEENDPVDEILVSSASEEDDIDAILAKILAESDDNIGAIPAFEDPYQPEIAEAPVEYCNFSNDYGSNTAKEKKETRNKDKTEDTWLITLMSVASALCLGIIGVLIYWLQLIP